MRIAIPVLRCRISPVLDTANELIVVDFQNSTKMNQFTVNWESQYLTDRIRSLENLNIDTVICGALSKTFEQMLQAAGIVVHPFICGNVDRIIRAFLLGRPLNREFHMPGCGRCGRRRQQKIQRGNGRRNDR